MARRNDHSREQIKELALNAAEYIIDSKTLDGLTARRIASKMNYTVGTLYLVFDNLDDLIMHVNARTLDLLIERLEDALSNVRNQGERLALLVNEYLKFTHEKRHRWLTLYTSSFAVKRDFPVWYAKKITALYDLIFDQAQQLYPKYSDIELQNIAKVLWSSMHGASILAVSGSIDAIGGAPGFTMGDSITKLFASEPKSLEGKVA